MRSEMFHTQKHNSYFSSLHILNLVSSWHNSIQLGQLTKAESVPFNLEVRLNVKNVADFIPDCM